MRRYGHLPIIGLAVLLVGAAVFTTVADRAIGFKMMSDAESAHRQGRFEQSEVLFKDALKYVSHQYGEQSAKVADVLEARADLFVDTRRYREAESDLVQARLLRQQLFGTDSLETEKSVHHLGTFYTDRSNFAEAEACLHRALSIELNRPKSEHKEIKNLSDLIAQVSGPADPEEASILSDLGWLYSKQGAYDKSEDAYQHALKLRETTLGPNHQLVAKTLNDLGLLYSLERKFDKSEMASRRAASIANVH